MFETLLMLCVVMMSLVRIARITAANPSNLWFQAMGGPGRIRPIESINILLMAEILNNHLGWC